LLSAGCGKNQSNRGMPGPMPVKGVAAQQVLVPDTVGPIDPIANQAAPSGGTYTAWGSGFPKSLNMWLDYNSLSMEVTGLLFESLVALHATKNEAVGVLADSWSTSPDGLTFTFKIDPRAAWSDGTPVTAADIQFYYDVIMDPHNFTSLFRVDLKRFDRPEIIDEKTLRIHAHTNHWSNFWTAGSLSAFPKHAWSGVDFNKQNFEFPVVSGPYRIKEVEKNRFVSLERRRDWWGRSKRYNQGKYNFDFVKYRFIEDQITVLEAFKKGEFDVYPIYSSAIWMKQTDFDAIAKGWVVRQSIYNAEPKGYQGIAINLRREKFQDVRVRRALCFLINRQLMNEKLMYNQYFLLNSYFPDLYPGNTCPDRGVTPFNSDSARALLKLAGWEVGTTGLLTKNGKPFEISFMTDMSDLRHLNVYVEDLKKVGIKASIEQLSLSSLRKRMDNYNFDLFWASWDATRLRDPEAEWHSSTADQIASNNYAGVKDKETDRLIEMQKTEPNIDKRNEILRKIDRRLNEIVPYILLWQADHNRLLYWNRFGTPPYVLDKFDRENSIVVYWWLDPTKDAALEKVMKTGQSLPLQPAEVHYQE